MEKLNSRLIQIETMTGYKANSGNSIATIDHVNKAKAELSQGIASVAAMTNISQVQSDQLLLNRSWSWIL